MQSLSIVACLLARSARTAGSLSSAKRLRYAQNSSMASDEACTSDYIDSMQGCQAVRPAHGDIQPSSARAILVRPTSAGLTADFALGKAERTSDYSHSKSGLISSWPPHDWQHSCRETQRGRGGYERDTHSHTGMADSTGADGNGLLRPPPVPGTADSGNGSPPASRPRPLVDFGRQRSVSIVRLASANDVRSPSQAQSPPSASSSGVAAGAKHRGRAKTVSVVCPPKISEETTGASHTRQYDHATTSTDYARQAQQSSGIDGQPGEEGLGTDGNQGGEGGNSGVGSAGALGVGRSATNRKRAATSASRWSTSVRKARSGTVGSRHAASSSDTGGGDLENLSTSDAGRTEAYDSRVHDLLDVLDPEVQVLNTLGDIQNTLFIPYTGLFDRTRKVQLTRPPCAEPPREGTLEEAGEGLEERAEAEVLADLDQEARLDGEKKRSNFQKTPSYRPASGEAAQPQEGTSATAGDAMREKQTGSVPSSLETASTVEMPDRIERGQYFLLPSKLVDMSGWSEEEKAELDDYVRHLMHSRKEKLRRKWRGFRKYVSTREHTSTYWAEASSC